MMTEQILSCKAIECLSDCLIGFNHYSLGGEGKPLLDTPVETVAKGAVDTVVGTTFDR